MAYATRLGGRSGALETPFLTKMPTTARPNGQKRDRLRRLLVIAAVLAVGSLLVEEIANLEERAIGDVLGPMFFAIFTVSVLTWSCSRSTCSSPKDRPPHDGRCPHVPG